MQRTWIKRIIVALFVVVVSAFALPYIRHGGLLLFYKTHGHLFGDEGEAEALALMGRLGGSLEREYLLKGLERELATGANDQVLEGYVQGLIYSGKIEDIRVFGRYAQKALEDPKKAYIFLIMAYGIQELGPVQFSELIIPSPIVGEGYDKFGVGKPKGKITAEEKERFRKLATSFEAWWSAYSGRAGKGGG